MMRSRPTVRSAIGRFYYSMYHGMRATVFFSYDGDDHQRRETLPRRTPPDFPDSAVLGKPMKDARGYRNDADYDPYPCRHRNLRQAAKELESHAPQALLPIVRAYLKIAKGCGHV